jgi:pimeloyl-ACP methyl ester carboxylesterase
MPKVKANNITINYDQQGTGEPLILIPYLAADYACYAFQVAEYAQHFTCISIDLRGTGWGKRQTRRRLFHRAFRRRCRCVHASCGDPERARLRPVARRGHWHVVGGQVS